MNADLGTLMQLLTIGIAYAVIALVVSIAIIVFYLICMWRIFVKMGIDGWKALIPGYNLYLLAESLMSKKAAIALLSLWGMAAVLSCIASAAELPILALISVLPILAFIIASFVLMYKLGWSFGGPLFGVGCILCPIIFLPIIAFSYRTYGGYAPEV